MFNARITAHIVPLFVAPFLACAAAAGTAKLDKDTCDQLKGEQTKFMESGIAADLQKGPDWGKANLTAERLREIEHFILLDEELKFGCRQVTLTGDVLRAGEAAVKLEANPNPIDAPGADGGAESDGPSTNDGGGATPPGQTVRSQPAPKAVKPKPEKSAAAPAKPKAADAYQPPRTPTPANP